MTKQEMLSLLETKIRKDIPRLMEFREGCIIQNNYNEDLEIFLGYISIDGFSRVVLKDLYIKSIRIDIEGNLIIDEFDKYAYSIIGHEIMMNDVLEWLGKFMSFKIDNKGLIYKEWDTCTPDEFYRDYLEIENVKIDFSKPYLKDQSEELIKFFYNLTNK